mmetsp:Transcript_18566/g.22296  ORF Transcript_18566/g.22296 Transcript_18566/m.22296 type:complete len:265 (-) Transcript_18566:176-970(-)
MVSCFNIVATTILVASSFVIPVEAFSNLPPCSRRMMPPPPKWMMRTSTTTTLSDTTDHDPRHLEETSPTTTKFVFQNLKHIATTSALTFLLLLSPLTPSTANAIGGNVVVVRDVVVARSPSNTVTTTPSLLTSSPDVTVSPLFGGGGGVGISPFGVHPFGGFGFGIRISSSPPDKELQTLKQQQEKLESQIQSMEERKSQLSQGKGISHQLKNTLNRLEEQQQEDPAATSSSDNHKNNPMAVGASALKGGLPLRAVNALGRLQE